jgi:hypothetical protein
MSLLADPRVVYVPPAAPQPPSSPRRVPRITELWRAFADFYRDPVSWLALVVSSVTLCYVGGAAMFWFHAVHLGEGGPAISPYAHWLLDSTVAFITLTPVLVVLLPAATLAAQALAGGARSLVPWLQAALGGAAFAIVTTPGPIVHDLLVGRGTWLAQRATELMGDPSAPLVPRHEYPVLASLTQQLGAGVPLYVLLMGLTVLVVRVLVGARQRQNAGALPG